MTVSRETTPVYIYEEPNNWHPGLLREHILDPDGPPGDATLCGVAYYDLPDNSPPVTDPETGEIEYDKPWYSDHDVVVTFDCRSCIRIYEEGN